MKKNIIEHYSDKEALEFHNLNKSGKIEIHIKNIEARPIWKGSLQKKECNDSSDSNLKWLL